MHTERPVFCLGLWEFHESSDESEQTEDGTKQENDSNKKTGLDFRLILQQTLIYYFLDQAKNKTRKVICLQTRHLQENYEFWINILKEKRNTHSMQSSPNISSDDSSTPVITQPTLEEIIEAEETQSQGGRP